MRTVFADTFYWVALTNPDDTRYRDAVAFDAMLTDATIFTTDEVLVEFMTFFSADPWQRGRAGTTVHRLLADPEIRVIEQSRNSFLAGLDLYQSRPDKGYSLTDCISIRILPVIWRVIREFPEARRAVETALEEAKVRKTKYEQAA